MIYKYELNLCTITTDYLRGDTDYLRGDNLSLFCRLELENVAMYQDLPALPLTQSVHAKIYILNFQNTFDNFAFLSVVECSPPISGKVTWNTIRC
jgi:hypothetical protein